MSATVNERAQTEDRRHRMTTDEKATLSGVGSSAATAAGTVGAVTALGGGTSAAALTTGLATIGGAVGGGMLAGIAVCAAAPLAVGGAVYGLYKWLKD